MKFYKITRAQADLIGKIMYSQNQQFDPYTSEQIDGTFLISDTMYQLLKQRPEFAKIDFKKLPTITEASNNPKIKTFPK